MLLRGINWAQESGAWWLIEMSNSPERLRLGEILEDAGIADAGQLKRALEYASYKLLPVGRALMSLKYIEEPVLNSALKAQCFIRSGALSRPMGIEALRLSVKENITFDAAAKKLSSAKPAEPAPSNLSSAAPASAVAPSVAEAQPAQLFEGKAAYLPLEDVEVTRLLSRLEQVSQAAPQAASNEAGNILLQLADLHFAQNDCLKAAEFFHQAIEQMEKSGACDKLQLATACRKLANVHFVEGNWDKAKQYYEKTMYIRESVLGANHSEVAICFEDLGEIFDALGDYEEAEKHYLKSLKIKEPNYRQGSPELKPLFNRLFHISKLKGLQPQRKRVGDLAIDCSLVESGRVPELVRESKAANVPLGRALVQAGIISEDTLRVLLKAQMYISQGVLPEYVAVRAVKLAKQANISFDESLVAIGWHEEANPAESNDHMHELISTMEDILALERKPNPPKYELAGMCTRLGDLYYARGSFVEAEIYYKRAESLLTQSGQAPSPVTLLILDKMLAAILAQKRYAEAEVHCWRVLELTDKIRGSGHLDGGVMLQNISWLKSLQKSDAEAAQLQQWAKSVFANKVGVDHPHLTADDTPPQGPAKYYLEAGDLEKALSQFEICLQLQRAIAGSDNDVVCSVIKDYVNVLNSAQRKEQASRLAQHAGLQAV